jgi:hypothetical protein
VSHDINNVSALKLTERSVALLPDYPEHGCTFDRIAKKHCNQYVDRKLQLAVLFLGLRHAVVNAGAVDHPDLLCAYALCVS